MINLCPLLLPKTIDVASLSPCRLFYAEQLTERQLVVSRRVSHLVKFFMKQAPDIYTSENAEDYV